MPPLTARRSLLAVAAVAAGFAGTMTPTAAYAQWLKCTCIDADGVCAVNAIDRTWSRTRNRGYVYNHLKRTPFQNGPNGTRIAFLEGGAPDERVRLFNEEWRCGPGTPPPAPPPPPPKTSAELANIVLHRVTYLRSAGATAYLHAAGGVSPGAQTSLHACPVQNDHPNCQWRFAESETTPGAYYVYAPGGGAPALKAARGANGASVALQNCYTGQPDLTCQWFVEPSTTRGGAFYLRSAAGPYYLHANGGAKIGAAGTLHGCNKGSDFGNCQWIVEQGKDRKPTPPPATTPPPTSTTPPVSSTPPTTNAPVQAPEDVNARDAMGETALTRAAARGDVTEVRALLAKGAQPDLASTQGVTPLLSAVKSGRQELAKELLSAGANPMMAAGGATPIDAAVDKGDVGMTRLLLDNGARPNDGLVAKSSASGRRDMLDALLDAGGNPSAGLAAPVAKGDTSAVRHLLGRGARPSNAHVSAAVGSGSTDTLAALLDSGGSADVGLSNAMNAKNREMAMVSVQRGANGSPFMGAAVDMGHAPLLQAMVSQGADANLGMANASKARRPDLLRILLDGGADAKPPAFVASAAAGGDMESTVLLLDRGAPVDAGLMPGIEGGHDAVVSTLLDRGADATGATPISTAARLGHLNMVQRLHSKGGPVQPAITPACSSGHAPIVAYLADSGADPKGQDCMVGAVRGQHADVVTLLLRRGGKVDWHADKQGTTLTHVAAANADIVVLQKLIAAGAPVKVPDDRGTTPMNTAAQTKNNVPVLEALLKAGADVNTSDDKGKSVYKNAKGRQNKKWLKAQGAVK